MGSVVRFRVTSGVGTDKLAIGPNAYAADQEFTLTDDQVARWIDERMFELGYLVFVEELGGDEPQAWNSTAQHLVSGKSGQISNRYEGPWSIEQKYLTVDYVSGWNAEADVTDLARIFISEDCVLEEVQFPGVTLTTLAAGQWWFNVRKLPQGYGSAVSVFEFNGTAIDTLSHCAVGSTTLTDQTTAATNDTVNDMDLRLQSDRHVYFGHFDKFDGFWLDIGTTVNAVAATATYEYSQVTSSGTVQWTTLQSFTDGTVSSDKSFAQDGSVTFMRPGDWGKTTLASMASGAAPLYFVRATTAGSDFTASTNGNRVFLLSRCIRPKDNNAYCAKGDVLRIDSPLNATAAIAGAVTTGATQVVFSFRSLR